MGYSINRFTFVGQDEFDLNFAQGYSSRSDVTCEVTREGLNSYVEFDWLTDNQVRIDTTGLQSGDELVFKRTVSKTSLPVDFSVPGNSTREALETNAKHAVYLVHEILDGRVGDFTDINDETLGIVTEAVKEAISQSALIATYKYPVQIGGALTSTIVTNCGDPINISGVSVSVETAPNVPIEVLISTDEQVVASFNIDTAGEVTNVYFDELFPVQGKLEMTSVGGFTSGAVVHATLSGSESSFLNFAESFPDYLSIYTGARDA